MTEKTRRIDDISELSDAQLAARCIEWMQDLHEVTSSILKDGILMLLLEQNRRSSKRIADSSRRLECLTIVLGVLTAVLVWKEFFH